jgi:hypothetical protein
VDNSTAGEGGKRGGGEAAKVGVCADGGGAQAKAVLAEITGTENGA